MLDRYVFDFLAKWQDCSLIGSRKHDKNLFICDKSEPTMLSRHNPNNIKIQKHGRVSILIGSPLKKSKIVIYASLKLSLVFVLILSMTSPLKCHFLI